MRQGAAGEAAPCGVFRPLERGLLAVDVVAEGLAVAAEGEDGKGAFVVLGVDAVGVGGLEKVDLRAVEFEGLADAGYLCGGEGFAVGEKAFGGGEFLAVEALVVDECYHFVDPLVGDGGGLVDGNALGRDGGVGRQCGRCGEDVVVGPLALLGWDAWVLRAEKQHLLALHVVVDNEGRHGVEGGIELGGGSFAGRVGEDDDDVVQTGVETVDKDFGHRHLVDEVAVDVDLEHFALLGLH